MIIEKRFRNKRKEQSSIIEDAIKNDMSINNTFKELINNCSIITSKEVEESKQTGYITIKDSESNEVVGALYVRKYITINKKSAYTIELLLSCINSKTSDFVVSAINEFYSAPFCCIKLDSMPDMTIVVFKGTAICDSEQIYKEIALEYGNSGRIYLLQEEKILELQEFSSTQKTTLQNLVKHISEYDEDDFELTVPRLNQSLELLNK